MTYLRSTVLLGLMCLAPLAQSAPELPNFEVTVGGGVANSEPAFNIDLTLNIPLAERFSAQVNLDSDYVFDDPIYQDYAMSEINGLGFYRRGSWRVGAGMGVLEKESQDDSFETERVFITHTLASYLWDDVTLDWHYSQYSDDFYGAVSMQTGLVWYPDDIRKLAVYREQQDVGYGWRIEGFIQPQSSHQRLAFGMVVREGDTDFFPYFGLEMRYYFDRAISLKERDRRFH